MDIVLDKATLDTIYNLDSIGDEHSSGVYEVGSLQFPSAPVNAACACNGRCYLKQVESCDRADLMSCCRTHRPRAEKGRFVTQTTIGHWYVLRLLPTPLNILPAG